MKNKTLLFAALVSVFGWCCISCEPNEPSVSSTLVANGFSISYKKQVKFSKGNLQYTQSTNTWAFAANQYDMIGEANIENYELADKIDMFGWSGNTGAAKWGISTSTDNNDYSGDFADWGQNIGDGTTWRTLTQDEWKYLCGGRDNADSLLSVARINLDEAGTTYVNGLILLPDMWTCPEGITFNSGFFDIYREAPGFSGLWEATEQDYADHQTFTLGQWEKLEAAGAIFLPNSTTRLSETVLGGCIGEYWSATSVDSNGSKIFSFSPLDYSCSWIPYNRYGGKAVRLVQDL